MLYIDRVFKLTDAKYIKIALITRATEWGFSIFEVYVYAAVE
jgi:hypothetical protein